MFSDILKCLVTFQQFSIEPIANSENMGIDTLKQEDKGDKGSDMINYNEIGDNELEHFCDTLSSAKRFQYTLGSNFLYCLNVEITVEYGQQCSK